MEAMPMSGSSLATTAIGAADRRGRGAAGSHHRAGPRRAAHPRGAGAAVPAELGCVQCLRVLDAGHARLPRLHHRRQPDRAGRALLLRPDARPRRLLALRQVVPGRQDGQFPKRLPVNFPGFALHVLPARHAGIAAACAGHLRALPGLRVRRRPRRPRPHRAVAASGRQASTRAPSTRPASSPPARPKASGRRDRGATGRSGR